jgi:hypothetical protein
MSAKKRGISQLGQEGEEVVLYGLEQNVELNGAHGVLLEWSEADASWLVDLHDKNLLGGEPGRIHVSKIGYKHHSLQTSNSSSDLSSGAANMRHCITPILVHQNEKKVPSLPLGSALQ